MGKNNKGANKGTAQNAAPAVAKTEKEKIVVAPAAEPAKVPAEKAPESKTNKKPAVDAAAKAENTPVVEVEDAGNTGITLTTSAGKSMRDGASKMSPDAKVNLACLMQKRYIDNPDASMKYPQAFLDEADNLIDNIALLAILDIREDCIERGLDLNTTVNSARLLNMTEACKMLGITLPKPKLLSDGQQQLNFVDATVDANIEKVVKEDRQARKRIEEKIPVLDPSKITTEEEVIAALEYQLRLTQNGTKNIIATIDWLRDYTLFKTTKSEEKPALKLEPMSYWIDEIFKRVKPTMILTGIGRSIYTNIACDGNPLCGHAIIHNQAMKENREGMLTEVQIAEFVTALLKHNALFVLNEESEKMKDKTIIDDRAMQALLKGNETLIDGVMSQKEPVDKKIYNMIRNAYFPAGAGIIYVDFDEQIRTKLGQILNLYLPISERMERYPEIIEGQGPRLADAPAEEKPAEEKKN